MKYLLRITVLFLITYSSYGQVNYKTPLEKYDFKKLSQNSEILNFLVEVSDKNTFIKVDTIYETIKKKKVAFVKISSQKISSANKVGVLLIAQQHGNEPSGKEGLLLLIKEIANGNHLELLERMDLLIIPQANPDGGDANTRRNSKKIDMNRDHLVLESDENIAIHRIFDKYLPEISIDIHEYYPYSKEWEEFGLRKNFDVQVGCLTNINVNKEILSLSKDKILPYVIDNIRNNGYSSNEYIVGSLPDGESLRYSTTDINDARQSIGIQNGFSFIIEGINGKDSIYAIEHRSKCQYLTVLSFLNYIYLNHKEIKTKVLNARNFLIYPHKNDSVVIRMDHFKSLKPLKYQLFSLKTNKDTIINVENFCSEVKALAKIKKPIGYLIPVSDSLLVEFVKKNNFIYMLYKSQKQHIIKQYIFKSFSNEVIEEQDVFTPIYENEIVKDIKSIDYYYIPVSQLKSTILVLAFEPLSMYGLAVYKKYRYLFEKVKYPLLRIDEQ